MDSKYLIKSVYETLIGCSQCLNVYYASFRFLGYVNAALFQAFEAVYKDVSKNLGLAVARQLQGEDI